MKVIEFPSIGAVQFHRNARAKNLRIIIKRDQTVRVTVPRYCPLIAARAFVSSRARWITTQRQKLIANGLGKIFSAAEIEALRQQAKEYIPARVAELAEEFGFSYGQIRIKNITSRWGSCSSKQNLNFSLFLMQFPPNYVDYVILHELCHTEHMNHGSQFWGRLEAVCPNARQIDKALNQVGRVV